MSTTKSEYTQLCTEILDAVGGSKNIKNVFHCITRLRIVPVNRDAVDMDKLSKVSGILKVVESSGQIQCVIGTTVPEVYEEFLAMSGVAAGGAVEAEPATDDVPEKKPNIITRGLNTLASCVTPGLYAIVAGGMIKGIVSLLTAIGLVSSKSDIITVLNAVGDAPFYFMPFIIGYAAAKRFKVKEIFGIMTAGILMYSTFLSPKEGITGYAFGPINIPAYNYKGSIFPVILSVWIFSIIFHLIDKHMPKNLRIVFSGALSFLISAPLFLGFAAPLGNWIAKGMTSGFAWLFTHAGPFAGALFCGIIPLTIIFGIKGWSAVELRIWKFWVMTICCPTSSTPIWLFPVLFWHGHSSRSPVSSVLPLFLPAWSAFLALPSLPCTVLHCRKRSLCMLPWQAVPLPVPAPC